MSINKDTDINLALLQLGKNKNRYRLDQTPPPHKIIEWDTLNEDSQPTDDELNTAYTTWKTTEEYKINRAGEYPSIVDQLDYIYHNGIDKWKTDVIDPVKAKYPKP